MAVSELARLVNQLVRHGVSQRRAEQVVPRLLPGQTIRSVRAAYAGRTAEAAQNRRTIFQRSLAPKVTPTGTFLRPFRATVQFIGRNTMTSEVGVFYRTIAFRERLSTRQAVEAAIEALTDEPSPGSDPLDLPTGDDADPLGGSVVTYHQAAFEDQIV